MHFRSAHLLRLLICCIALSASCRARAQETVRFLFLVDCSASMWNEFDGQQKMAVAKRILSSVVDSLNGQPNITMALRAYGHTSPAVNRDCKDTRLEVPFNPSNGAQIKEAIQNLRPSGTTPIAYSLGQAGGDFPDRHGKNVIILITDGYEECSGDPCEVSARLLAQGATVQPFIVGIGVKEDFAKQYACVGQFVNAKTITQFQNLLSGVVQQVVNRTLFSLHLQDSKGKPTETNVPFTIGKTGTSVPSHFYIHTRNQHKQPDSFLTSPQAKATLRIHTFPNIDVPVTIVDGKTNVKQVKAAQGTTTVRLRWPSSKHQPKSLVFLPNDGEQVTDLFPNSAHPFLVGKYDVVALTTPITSFRNQTVGQSANTNLTVAAPGKTVIYTRYPAKATIFTDPVSGYGQVISQIQSVEDNEEFEYLLQPGNYRVVYRSTESNEINDSRSRTFTVKEAGNHTVILE